MSSGGKNAEGLVRGATVRVTSHNTAAEGVVLCVDAKANLCVLIDGGDRVVCSTGQGCTVDVLKPADSSTPLKHKMVAFDAQDLEHRKVNLLNERKEAETFIGLGVSPLAQQIFDAVNKTYPCVWQDDVIVVMKSVFVAPPYTADATTGDESTRQRIQAVVTQARQKLSQ
jgi:hypothetical protein